MADLDERFSDTANASNPVTRTIGPGSTRTSLTLFDRIGGEKILDQIVTDVYNDMKSDKEIGKFFARFRLERLKDRTVDYLRGEWGGAEIYKGSDLWISHSHMGLKNQWYDVMMKYYVKALKKARVSKADQQEVLSSLEKMRAPIVDRDLKFKNMYLKHSEKLAQAAGGDGWGKKPNASQQAEADAKAKEAKEKEAQALKDAEESALKAKEEAEKKAKAKAKAAARKKKEAEEKAAREAEESATTKEPSSGEDGGSDKTTKDVAAFNFVPDEDAPPAPLPGSAPSGSDLLGRLSVSAPWIAAGGV